MRSWFSFVDSLRKACNSLPAACVKRKARASQLNFPRGRAEVRRTLGHPAEQSCADLCNEMTESQRGNHMRFDGQEGLGGNNGHLLEFEMKHHSCQGERQIEESVWGSPKTCLKE